MDPAGPDALRDAIRHLHGCDARFVAWERARDTFGGEVAFDRKVGVFELVGHGEAKRAYAWTEPGTGTKRRYFAVLSVPPIDSATAAVRASIAADARAERS